MTDKTKRIILIAVCCLLCIAAAVGIAVRFGGNADISSGVVSDDPTQSGDPNVDIDNNSQTDLDVQMETPDASETDPAQGADSSGLEQTIQADPVKPESPEKPEAPAGTTTLPDDHDGADVPEEERKTEDEAPPTYEETPTVTPAETEPAAGSTNSSGQVYVPGFGYVENSGANQGGTLDDMYENGNKIGIMGGEQAPHIPRAQSESAAPFFYRKESCMRKILALFLSLALLLGTAMPAFAATGEGNIDGGGGNMGSGNSSSYWNPGMDGVRVTVINAESHAVVTTPVDLTNKTPSTGIIHFGKVCKLTYNGGASLSPVVGGYSYRNPSQSLPRIISSGSSPASIEAIRSYFTDEQVIRSLAGYVGMDFDTLVNGDYKIIIEPIAYLNYDGQQFAMTATEAALYDQVVSGNLRYWMGSLTHQNLPLAIFLEEADLGYPAWSGSTTSKVSNEQIISSLGIGIVRFNDEVEEPEVDEFDYEYRVDTDVITSVEVSGGQSDPDNPVTVQFVIEGSTYTVSNVYYPDGDSQLVWVKWHTPDEPCVCTIQVRVLGGGTAQSTITANIVDLDGNDPPNPVADDRNDTFTLVDIPEKEEVASVSWGIWSPWWQENWVWVENWEKCWHTDRWTDSEGKSHTDRWYHWVDNGWWEDQGWWEFDYNAYTAGLTATMVITPDSLSPTASSSALKSGYGIQQSVTASVSTTQSSAVTAAQNAVTYFPEFNYEGFWRLLDRSISGKRSAFTFKDNPYSTYNRPTHFTPIWYPDGSYTPYTWLLDCWTPAGMLSLNLTDSLRISGDLWEDWHIAPTT